MFRCLRAIFHIFCIHQVHSVIILFFIKTIKLSFLIIKLFTKRNKEVVLCLVQINIHIIHIYIKYIYMYIYYLFIWDNSFEGLALIISLFLIINIIFRGVSNAWILKVFCFHIAAKPVKNFSIKLFGGFINFEKDFKLHKICKYVKLWRHSRLSKLPFYETFTMAKRRNSKII